MPHSFNDKTIEQAWFQSIDFIGLASGVRPRSCPGCHSLLIAISKACLLRGKRCQVSRVM